MSGFRWNKNEIQKLNINKMSDVQTLGINFYGCLAVKNGLEMS